MMIKHEKKKLLLVMGIVYLSYILGIIKSLPLHTSTDELGAIIGAAALSGRDWSGVVDNSGYYGFGYYSLFFWLFQLTNSPIVIYRVIIIITSFLRVLIIPIAYYIAQNYMQIKSERVLYLCAILMPFLYSSSVGVISNEYVLELLIWIIILLVCKVMQYQNNKFKRTMYLCVLTLSCFYSFFIHTRALVIIIAVLIVFFFRSIFDKSRYNKVLFASVSIGFTAGYVISKILISLYQAEIYGKKSEEIRNATIVVSTQFSILNSDTWSVWFHMLLGIINSEVLVTGGLFLICAVAFCFYILKLGKRFVWKENVYCNVIFCISVLCMGATICAFLLSRWFEGMLSVWGGEGAGYDYSFKGLTYIRYWNIYMPPFILSSIGVLKYLDCKKILSIAGVIYIFLQVCFMNFVIPIIQKNGSAASTFFGLAGYCFGDAVSENLYYKVVIISSMIFLLIIILGHTKYKKGILLLVFFFMFIQQNSKVYLYDNEVKETAASKILTSYKEKCELERRGIYIDQIYLCNVSQNTDANWKLNSIAQFYFNEYTLQEKIPEQIGQYDIIISDGKNEDIQRKYKGIHCYILDENEIWYTYLNIVDL